MLLTSTAPVNPILSTSDAKTHLRVTHTADDSWIAAAVLAATNKVESFLRRSLITQTKTLTLDAFPDGEIELFGAPIQSVTSVKHTNSAGTVTTLDASGYVVDAVSLPGRIMPASGTSWPTGTLQPLNGVQVVYVAGYGDDSTGVPPEYIQAVKRLIAHWYENRGDAGALETVDEEFNISLIGDVIHRL